MIEIISPPRSQSGAALRAALADLEIDGDLTVSWGAGEGRADLNGQRRKTGSEQLKLLAQSGLPCPLLILTYEQAVRFQRENPDKLVFGRKENHTQGRDICTVALRRRFRESDYWTVCLDVTEEWRIHVFKDKSIARGTKHFVLGTESPRIHRRRRDLPIRNRLFGYRMRHDIEPPSGLRRLAKQAVTAMGYDFGAVDIVCGPNGPHVLEVNKAPGLDNYTARAYARAIERYLQ